MKKPLQRMLTSLSLLAFFLCLFIRPVAVRAATESSMPSVTTTSITSYAFSAKAGDSLSRIVRRALQLRAITDQPTAMYCENIISTELGGEFIEVSQQVVVTYSQIDSCAASSKSLTAEQRIAWQAYADTADFNVSDITPTNNSANVVPAQQDTTLPEATSPTTPKNTAPTSAQPKASQTNAQTKQIKKPLNYSWFIALAAVIIGLFLVNGSLGNKHFPR